MSERPGWTVERIEVVTARRRRGVAAWRHGCVAIDFRVLCPPNEAPTGLWGWTLTHVPSGRGVFSVLVSMDEAMEIAEAVAAWPGFDRTGRGGGEGSIDLRFFRPRYDKMRTRLGPRFIAISGDMVPPWEGPIGGLGGPIEAPS